jgi:hypothetical protein
MTANPTDLVYVDGVPVSKAAVRSFDKVRVRLRMADATEVRNTNLAGQFAGVDIASLDAVFDLDTGDTTSPDDGVNTIISFDGGRFKRRVDEGGFVPRDETGTGDIGLSTSDSTVLLKPASAAARQIEIPDDLEGPVRVIDANGSWSDVNVSTFVAEGGGTINGATEWLGMTPYGEFIFTPLGGGNFLAR